MGRSTVQLHTGKASACQKEEDEEECRPKKDHVVAKDRDEGSGDQDPPEDRPWQKKLLGDARYEDRAAEKAVVAEVGVYRRELCVWDQR